MLQVVAAVIERDGRILIGQRPPGKTHAMQWEFPGGKVEAGESLRDALTRELREELAIDAEVGREIDRYEFGYANQKPIELIFFEVLAFTGEPANRVFHQIRWVKRGELSEYAFLKGDRQFIERMLGYLELGSNLGTVTHGMKRILLTASYLLPICLVSGQVPTLTDIYSFTGMEEASTPQERSFFLNRHPSRAEIGRNRSFTSSPAVGQASRLGR